MGRAKTSNDIIVKDIDWLHFVAFLCLQGDQLDNYDDLPLPEFAFGYLSSVLDCTGYVYQAGMRLHMQYLKGLMRDAVDYMDESGL